MYDMVRGRHPHILYTVAGNFRGSVLNVKLKVLSSSIVTCTVGGTYINPRKLNRETLVDGPLQKFTPRKCSAIQYP